jgi:hypothetical protein
MYEILRTLPQHAHVLDLGSRGGSFGLDACPGAVVVRLDTELSTIPGSGWFVQADAAYLPFRNGIFDAVIANHVLELSRWRTHKCISVRRRTDRRNLEDNDARASGLACPV